MTNHLEPLFTDKEIKAHNIGIQKRLKRDIESHKEKIKRALIVFPIGFIIIYGIAGYPISTPIILSYIITMLGMITLSYGIIHSSFQIKFKKGLLNNE